MKPCLVPTCRPPAARVRCNLERHSRLRGWCSWSFDARALPALPGRRQAGRAVWPFALDLWPAASPARRETALPELVLSAPGSCISSSCSHMASADWSLGPLLQRTAWPCRDSLLLPHPCRLLLHFASPGWLSGGWDEANGEAAHASGALCCRKGNLRESCTREQSALRADASVPCVCSAPWPLSDRTFLGMLESGHRGLPEGD